MDRIVVDYDGTLFDKGIYPIEHVVAFLRDKQVNHNLVVVTSRSPVHRMKTEAPVVRLGLRVSGYIYGQGDDNPEFKAAVVSKLENVVLAIDNNYDVLVAYEALGITTLHPDEIRS